jgi:ATP adenylyltransferase
MHEPGGPVRQPAALLKTMNQRKDQMERMWSPWRSQHLDQFAMEHRPPHGTGSIFARMVSEDRDEENFILWRGRHVFAVMNLYPYNNGHLLIVPNREVAAYQELSGDEKQELLQAMDRAISWLDRALAPDGYNIGLNLGEAAGAGFPEHLQMHIVPRWRGDTNFMPTIANVKVIPEAIRETYLKLKSIIETERSSQGVENFMIRRDKRLFFCVRFSSDGECLSIFAGRGKHPLSGRLLF